MKISRFCTRCNSMTLTSIPSFAGIRGGMNQQCKDVYFIRCIGVSGQYLDEIREMDRRLTLWEQKQQGHYVRTGELPRLSDPQEIAFYSDIYGRFAESGRTEVFLKNADKAGEGAEVAALAAKKTLELFGGYSPNASESILRNFGIKLLFWADHVLGRMLRDWNGKQADKLVYTGKLGKQEYLFCYFATLLGMDVLILKPVWKEELEPELLKLSQVMHLGTQEEVVIPPYSYQEEAKVSLSEVQSVSGPAADQADSHTGRQKQEMAPSGPAGAGSGQTGEQRIRVQIPERNRPGRAGSQISAKAPAAVPVSGQERTASAASRQQRTGLSAARQELEFEQLALLASSVVMVSVYDERKQMLGTGSGIMIGEAGYILTNHHVARGGCIYAVRMEEEEQIYETDEIIKYHSVLDLAVIRIDRRLKPIPIYQGGKPLVRGQKVVAIGSPLGLFNSVSDGIISGFRKIDDVDMIQFTAPISHGSSGGAVLNMYGEVIGISTAGIDSGQNINLAVGYESINAFVRGFV